MGIHTGEVNLADTHRGVAVHRVAHISAAAHGGQIVLSQSTQTTVEDVEALVPDLSVRGSGRSPDQGLRPAGAALPARVAGLDARLPPLFGARSRADRTQADELRVRSREARSASRRPTARARRAEAARGARPPCSECGRVVSTERLIDRLWGEQPPQTAATSLQNVDLAAAQAARGRRRRHQAARISCCTSRRELDVRQLRAARARGARARTRGARELLREALALWRGPPLADFAYEPFAERRSAGSRSAGSAALEERIDAELELGRGSRARRRARGARRAESAARAAPRPADARALPVRPTGRGAPAYQEARRALVEELGHRAEPGAPGALTRRFCARSRALSRGAARGGRGPLGEIVRALLAGRLVAVLGPGRACRRRHGRCLAASAREVFDCPASTPASWRRSRSTSRSHRGRAAVRRAARASSRGVRARARRLSRLARLPGSCAAGRRQQLLVTTGYDQALERAFEEAGEEIDVVSYLAVGRDRGKFLHRSADGSATVIEVPNTYAELSLDRADDRSSRSTVRSSVRPEREWESFVVSEDDYIDYLAQTDIANVVPGHARGPPPAQPLPLPRLPAATSGACASSCTVSGATSVGYRSWAVRPERRALERSSGGSAASTSRRAARRIRRGARAAGSSREPAA